MKEETSHLLTAIGELPAGHVPITERQFVSTLTDARIPSLCVEIIEFCHQIGDVLASNVDEKGVDAVADYVECVRGVTDAARRVGWFAPPPSIDPLRTELLAVAQRGVEIGHALLRLVSATSWQEADAAHAALQAALADQELFDRFSEALAAFDEKSLDDVDARIGLLLGTSGHYTDEFGAIDLVAICAPAGGDRSSIAALGDRAAGYLRHLLGNSDLGGIDASGLLLPAVLLSAVQRPVPAHTAAVLTRALIDTGQVERVEATNAAVTRYSDEGARVFDAYARATRELRLLHTGALDDPVDVVVGLVSIYRRLAEGPFRSVAAFIDHLQQAHGAAAGKRSPMLGRLARNFGDRDDELSNLLAAAIDVGLRNAEAHEDFYVDPESLAVVFDNRRIELDELEDALERLSSMIAAVDAAVQCYVLVAGRVEVPAWIRRGDRPAATAALISATAALFGHEVDEVEMGSTITVLLAQDDALTRSRCLTIAASAAAIDEIADVLIVFSPTCHVEVAARALRAWSAAPNEIQDLHVALCQLDAELHTPTPTISAYARALAAITALLFSDASETLSVRNTAIERRRLATRLRWVSRLINSWPPEGRRADQTLVAILRRSRDLAAQSVSHPDGPTVSVSALEPIAAWLDATDAVPLFDD